MTKINSWKYLTLFLFFVFSSCNNLSSNSIPLKPALPALSTTTKEYSFNLNCESVLTIPIGNEINEFGLIAPEIESFNPPILLTIDEENRIYLDDQANGRIFIYDENYDLISIVNIPSYVSEDANLFRLPIWLGMIVNHGQIFILHNTIFTENSHAIVTVHDLQGTELAQVDISAYSGVPDGYINDVMYASDRIRLYYDSQDGVIFNNFTSTYIHITGDLQLSTIHPDIEGLDIQWNISPGPDGTLFYLGPDGLIYRLNMDFSLLGDPIPLLDQISRYGITEYYLNGIDRPGNIYFASNIGGYDTGTHIIGRYDPLSEEIWVASLNATMENGYHLDLRNIKIAPDGTVYTFDDANWPASRDLLRCEFVPNT